MKHRNEVYAEAAKEGRGLEVPPPGQCLGQHYDVVHCVDACVSVLILKPQMCLRLRKIFSDTWFDIA